MPYSIRLADESDAIRIAEMLRLYMIETYSGEWGGNTHSLPEHLRQHLVKIAVAETGGISVGFLAYIDTYDLHWSIQGAAAIDFYVIPEHRGLGAAVHLVAWVANEARGRDASFLKGGAVENPTVRKLYEKVALFHGGEAYVSGRAFRHLAGLSGKSLREIVRNLPQPEWGREA